MERLEVWRYFPGSGLRNLIESVDFMKRMMRLLIVCALVATLFAGCSGAKPTGSTNENSSTSDNTTINTKGNTSGNINNGGMVAQQGDWLYYYNDRSDGGCFKMKTDGTEKTEIQ